MSRNEVFFFLAGKWDKLTFWRKKSRRKTRTERVQEFLLKTTKSHNCMKKNKLTKDNTFSRKCFVVFRCPFLFSVLVFSSSSYSFILVFLLMFIILLILIIVSSSFSFLFFYPSSPLLSVLCSFFLFSSACLSKSLPSLLHHPLPFSSLLVLLLMIFWFSCFSSPFFHVLLDLLLHLIFLALRPVNTSCLQFGRPPKKTVTA